MPERTRATMDAKEKYLRRRRRHWRVRRKVFGTPERPRLCVFRSNKHIYAQIIDDTEGRTLLTVGTLSPEVRTQVAHGGNVEAARVVGARLAELARKRGIVRVAFDRAGYRYHGRVKALAEAARAGGLEF